MDARQPLNFGDVLGPKGERSGGQLFESLVPPRARVTDFQIALHAFKQHFPIGNDAQNVRPATNSGSRIGRQQVGLGQGD